MSRYVDIEPIIASHTNAEYKVSDISFAEVLHAPTITTKQVKYYDDDENVWKIGEVIVSDSEKPNNCDTCKHYMFTDIDGYYCEHETYGQPCHYEPKDEPQTERSSE